MKREEFEDTEKVIRIRKLKKDRQHNGQKKKGQKDKQRSTKHTHKTKERVARTPLKTGGELNKLGGLAIRVAIVLYMLFNIIISSILEILLLRAI